MAATWPSIIPLGRHDVGAGVGLGHAPPGRRARGWRRCRPSPSGGSTPQWPWSVYSSRHRSAISTSVVADLVAQVAQRDLDDAVGVPGLRALGVLGAPARRRGSPPGTPRSASRATSLRSDSRVCCTTPGQRGDRARARRCPRARTAGATRSSTRQPGLGHQAAQRRGAPQPAEAAGGEASCRQATRSTGRGQARPTSGGDEAVDGVLGRPRRSTVEPGVTGGRGGDRADARDDRRHRVRRRRASR